MKDQIQAVLPADITSKPILDISSLDTWPEWIAFGILLAVPIILALVLTFAVTKMQNKMYIAKYKQRWDTTRGYWTACLSGFFFGAWSIWAFQEIGAWLIGIPHLSLKIIFNTGLIVGLSNPFVYDILRSRGAQADNKWLRALAKSLSVPPKFLEDHIPQAEHRSTDLTQIIFDDETTERRN